MPRRSLDNGFWTQMEYLPLGLRRKVPEGCQRHWYELVRRTYLAPTDRVLDVGAGDGSGLDILRRGRPGPVFGTDPLPLRDDISAKPLESWNDGEFDWVTAMDVIEHVEADRAFLAQMLRVSRRGVFFSTPNWDYSQCGNPYHCREYTPLEFQDLVEFARKCKAVGEAAGRYTVRVEYWTSGKDAVPIAASSVWNLRNNFGVAIIKEDP